MFRLLAAENRHRILGLLASRPMAVNEIARKLGVSQPAVSQHLAQLRDLGLVRARRDGQFVVYEAVPEALARYRLGTRAFGWRFGRREPGHLRAYREFLKAELDQVDRDLDKGGEGA